MPFRFRFGQQKAVKQDTRPKAFLADRLYLPSDRVRLPKLKQAFERYVYRQALCNRCPVYRNGERFSELCQPCDGFQGYYKTWDETTIKDDEYCAVPAGDLDYVEKSLDIDLEDFNIQDLRSDVKAENPLTFTGKLFTGRELRNGKPSPDQVGILKQFYKSKRGIICAPPRFGKTIVGTHIICKYKRRVLVIAHEKQLLRQFYKSLLNFTNLKDLRKSTGQKIAGIIQDDRDWSENWDVVFCTYQSFITEKGFERVKTHLINKFGVAMVDEAHLSPAAGYSRFISKLNMKYKIAITATPNRKDGLGFILTQIMGPVVAKSEVVSMLPTVDITYTSFKPKSEFRGRAGYTKTNQFLAGHRERKIMLIKQIFKDLRENPRHCIMIPVLFVNQAVNLAKLINEQGQYNNQNKGEKWSDELAVAYYDDKKKQQSYLLDEARKGDRVRVLIGIRRMFKVGIDVPSWTHMYLTFPMNNQEDFYQMTQRICTPYEGKPQPVLRMVVDPIGLSQGCFIATYHHIKHYKYPISAESIPAVKEIFASRKPKNDTEDW